MNHWYNWIGWGNCSSNGPSPFFHLFLKIQKNSQKFIRLNKTQKNFKKIFELPKKNTRILNMHESGCVEKHTSVLKCGSKKSEGHHHKEHDDDSDGYHHDWLWSLLLLWFIIFLALAFTNPDFIQCNWFCDSDRRCGRKKRRNRSRSRSCDDACDYPWGSIFLWSIGITLLVIIVLWFLRALASHVGRC